MDGPCELPIPTALRLRVDRLERQRACVAAIAVSQAVVEGDVLNLARQLVEAAAEVTGVSRVSIWLFDPEGSELRCLNLYESRMGRHSSGGVLHQEEYRDEFAALQGMKFVAAEDARCDPCMKGYVEGYLKPNGIVAMLDAVIRIADKSLGTLCFEWVEQTHRWDSDEIAFACQLADQVALTINTQQRRQSEKALRASEARWRAIFEISPYAVAVNRQCDGTFVAINPAFERHSGYCQEEVLGKTPLELGMVPDVRDHVHLHEMMQRDGRIAQAEISVCAKHGERKHVLVSVANIEWDHEPCVVSACVDITEQHLVRESERRVRELQEQLIHLGRISSLGDLAAGLAHEVNQPLAAIRAYAQGCLRLIEDPEEHLPTLQAPLEAIVEGTRRISEVIRRLRHLVGRRTPRRSSAQINELIHDVVALLRRALDDHRVTLELQLAEDLPPLVVDSVQIQQVLLNLLKNAMEAVVSLPAEQRRVTVSTRMTAERRVMVVVEDDGPGVPPLEEARLFQPFFSTKPDGLGVGLSLSRTIVEAHGGRITWENRPERGCAFSVALPLGPEDLTNG